MKKISYLQKKIKENIKQIGYDKTSGSLELTKKAVETMNILGNISLESPFAYKGLIQETALKLVFSQPSMASIFTFSNSLLLNIDKLNNSLKIRDTLLQHCKKFIEHLNISSKKISQLTLNAIENDSTIITHSYSSSVLDSLIYAKKQGKNFCVICTESRPMNEGVKLASKLGKYAIKVRLVTDAAIYDFFDEANMIIVGGDAIIENGLVNKTGTLGLAIASTHYNVNFYCLCETVKILPAAYNLKIEKKNPKEIYPSKIENVTPINYYFDVTPLNLITGIITEKGIKKHTEIQNLIEKYSMHRLFKNH
jgi:translation initiation factor 2B subunit (eIF-2B alpha/beta/delta family)